MSWLQSWLLPPTAGRAAPPWPPSAGPTAGRPPKPRLPLPPLTQIDRPRIARPRIATAPVHYSAPFRSASLLLIGSFHPPSEYMKHPQRFKTVSPAWPTQPLPMHYGSTRVSEEGCYTRCFYHPARAAKRRVMVDNTKVNLPLPVRRGDDGLLPCCPDLREGRGRNSLWKIEVS